MLRKTASAKGIARPLVNEIGQLGEKIVELKFLRQSPTGTRLFNPAFLGDKWEAVDLFVEVNQAKAGKGFFFIQVKSTSKKIGARARTIQIKATKKQCSALHSYPAPTYIMGVDIETERIFLRSVHNSPTTGISSIPISNEVTKDDLSNLHKEVSAFWSSNSKKPKASLY